MRRVTVVTDGYGVDVEGDGWGEAEQEEVCLEAVVDCLREDLAEYPRGSVGPPEGRQSTLRE